MGETSISSERFVGFQDVITPPSTGGDATTLETWTASVSTGPVIPPGSWTPMAVRIRGIAAAEIQGFIAMSGSSFVDTIERDGWLYPAKGGRPVLCGAIAAGDGGVTVRMSAGTEVTSRFWAGSQGLTALMTTPDGLVRNDIGIQGWEELNLMAEGSPRIGRFAHVAVATPDISIDHGSLNVRPDGKLHIEGDVIDPFEAVTGSEAMQVMVNDTVAELSAITNRASPTLPGGGRRRFTATVPLPKTKMLVWVVATNAAGGQAYDRMLVDDGAFSADWPSSRAWARVSRYRFGSLAGNQVLTDKNAGWKLYVQAGEGQSRRRPIDVELTSDRSLVTKPVVVTRVDDQRADQQLLNSLSSGPDAVVLTVDDLDADLYVVVEAPAIQRHRWHPDPTVWEATAAGWRRRIEQAGLEVSGDHPAMVMGSGGDQTNLTFAAKARNLSPGDVIARVGSAEMHGVPSQVIGTVSAPTDTTTRPVPRQAAISLANAAVSLRLGVNQIGLDAVRDSEGQAVATQEDIGVYVVDPQFPYSPVSVVDVRSSTDPGEDHRNNPPPYIPPVPAPPGPSAPSLLASGRVFVALMRPGIEVTDAALNRFLTIHHLNITGTTRHVDESGQSQLVAWIEYTGPSAIAYGTIMTNGAPFFDAIGGNEGPSALMTDVATKMKNNLDNIGWWHRLFSRVQQREYSDLKMALDNELVAAQANTVFKTLGTAAPVLTVLDCRYSNKSVNDGIFRASDRGGFSNTRIPFNDAYRGGLSQRQRVPGSDFQLAKYQFLGYDQAALNRKSDELQLSGNSPDKSPRVFLSAPSAQSIDTVAQQAATSRGVMIVIHGFNNGQGIDNDEQKKIRVNLDDDDDPYRVFVRYWPVLDTTVRDPVRGIISAQVPIIHVWWSGAIDRSKWILNIPLKATAYPAGAFFNMDVAAAHFTGYYKVAPFIESLSTKIQGLAPGVVVPITILAESLGNRVAVSAFDALNAGLNPGWYKESGMTRIQFLALHPAMRQIDLTSSWVTIPSAEHLSEERERKKPSPPTTFTHPYPESPLIEEMAALASANPLQCRTFLAYSAFDKAGAAFLAAQRDNPHSDDLDYAKPTGMIGRRGIEGAGAENGAIYGRQSGRANIAAFQIGLNDGGAAGGEGERDYWHVDLWGWALPDQPYRSRSLYGNNLPQSSFSGYEGQYDNAYWIVPAPVIAPGLEVKSIIEAPFWNQIALPAGLINRAWRLPKLLMQNGSLSPTPP
jgi:hypothetical protein